MSEPFIYVVAYKGQDLTVSKAWATAEDAERDMRKLLSEDATLTLKSKSWETPKVMLD